MNEIKIKKSKDINWTYIIRAGSCFLILVFVLLTLCIWNQGVLFTWKYFFILSLCAIPLSIFGAYTVEKLGSVLGGGWASKKISPREQLSADLARARYSKGRGQFDEALNIINQVVQKDPAFPDALYLKAHILWEGYKDSSGALENLDKVMKLVQDPEEPLHRWAVNYYHEILKAYKNRK
jgi:tetratricopeptide (TPR) repeat protein